MTRSMWIQVGILSVVALATVVIGYIVWSDVWPEQKTVEAEEEDSRSTIAHIGQHHPTVGQVDDENYDDPVWAITNSIPIKEA